MVIRFMNTDHSIDRVNNTGSFTFSSLFNQHKLNISLLCILILTALIYARSLSNGILSWDDMWQITYNLDIQTLSFHNLQKIFTSFYSGMYQPFVTLSYALEYNLFGLNSTIFHATNVLFHLANIALVFFLVLRITNRQIPAMFAACLFGIHPMHVESVVWITERKDVMYAFFYLSALLFYVKYLKENCNKYYRLTILFFIFSLLSKATAITFPLVLLLVDFYLQRKKKKNILIEKIPFFILAIVFSIINIFSQSDNSSNTVLQSFTIVDRLFLISYSLCYYLSHAFVPLNLSAFHFMPQKINGLLPTEYYLAIIPIIIFIFVLLRKKMHRRVTFALLFFIAALSPTIHIIPFGKAIVAERYAYLSYIGIYFILGLGLEHLMVRNNKTRFTLTWFIVVLVLGLFGFTTFHRIGVWHDTQTLFNDASTKVNTIEEANQLKAMGYNLDAEERTNAQDYSTAVKYYNEAISLDTCNAKLYHNRGYARHYSDDFEGAMKDYSKSIDIDPTYVRAYANRAIIYLKWNKQQEACADLRAAYNLGLYNIYEIMPVNCQ